MPPFLTWSVFDIFCTLKETDKGFRVIFNQRNEIHVLDRTKMTTLLTAQREREREHHTIILNYCQAKK